MKLVRIPPPAPTVRTFFPLDIVAIDVQDSQRGQFGIYEPVRTLQHGQELAASGPAWTVEDGEGEILCCAGLGEVWPGVQAIAWALFSRRFAASRRAIAVTREAMRTNIAGSGFVRIEAMARASHAAECRWLEAVGFTPAALLRRWGPHSQDHVLYERVS